MSAASLQPTPLGLPKFKDLEDRHKCRLCFGVLRNAVQTVCGHRYCDVCLRQEIEKKGPETRCPAGEEECEVLGNDNGSVNADFSARREIRKLIVYCMYKEYGCKKEMTWIELENHVNTCEFTPVSCHYADAGCEEKMLPSAVQEHETNDCKYRPVLCDYCNKTIAAIKLKTHIDEECPNVTVSCPDGCGVSNMPRSELAAHLIQCPKRKRECKYSSMACKVNGNLAELEDHYTKASEWHLDCVTVFTNHLDLENTQLKREMEDIMTENSTLKSGLDEASEGNRALTSELEQMKRSNRDLKMRMVTVTEKVIVMERRLDEIHSGNTTGSNQSQIDGLRTTLNDLQTAQEEMGTFGGANPAQDVPEEALTLVNDLERQLAMQNVRMAEMDLRFQVMETATFDGSMIWKIRDYHRRKRDAMNARSVSLYSQPFYTERHGYRMCARVYLNGDGMGKGTHVSLFFVVMRGDYDSLLSWPFQQRVTLMLIDQEHGIRHLTDNFFPDATSNSFKRPTAEMNVASGCPLFVSHAVLEEGTTYVKDDTIFFKLVVDTNGLQLI